MKITKPESKLRKAVATEMAPYWQMEWHEDREITPGIPDLHFHMNGAGLEYHQMGWLELKAIDTNLTASQRVHVEPSQHQFCRRWAGRVPVYFLVRVQHWIYLVHGKYHRELSMAACLADLSVISVITFEESQMANILPPILRQITAI